MTRKLDLETFDLRACAQPGGETVDLELEEARLGSFERGYRDGWSDCRAATMTAEAQLREAVGAQLQTLAFTFEEARDQVLRAVEPLLCDMVAKVLPAIAHDALVPMVAEQLRPVAAAAAQAQITIRLHPEARLAAEGLMPLSGAAPIRLADDAGLGRGQAMLSVADQESSVDLDAVIAAIGDAVSGFFRAHRPETLADQES